MTVNKSSGHYVFDSFSNTGATVRCMNQVDEQNRPAGGFVTFTVENEDVVYIKWQDGPLHVSDLNGAFVEDVLEVCRQRLIFYQETEFGCKENEDAIRDIGDAVEALTERTKKRIARGVEGTHQK